MSAVLHIRDLQSAEEFCATFKRIPQDWMLYNRLGATLANGGKPEEALQCYEEALNRNPGYVRAT